MTHFSRTISRTIFMKIHEVSWIFMKYDELLGHFFIIFHELSWRLMNFFSRVVNLAAVNWILQHTRRACTGKFPPGKRFDELITYITNSLTLDHFWHRHLYDLIRMKNNRESEFIGGEESWQLVTCIAVDLKGWFLILITLEMIHLLTVIVFLCTLLSCNGRLVNLRVIHSNKMQVIQYGMCNFGHLSS